MTDETTLQRYLEFSPIIDGDHPAVAAKAKELAAGCRDDVETARRNRGYKAMINDFPDIQSR